MSFAGSEILGQKRDTAYDCRSEKATPPSQVK
jgi:hypothetical protein